MVHLLYLCAYILQPGTSVIDISKAAELFQYWPQFVDDFDDGSCFPIDPAALFLGDASPAQVQAALPHLVRSPLSTFNDKPVGQAWKKLPVTYVHTDLDYAVPRAYQDIMIQRAESEGFVIEKHTFNTSHSVFITKQKEMVDLALEASKDKRNPH